MRTPRKEEEQWDSRYSHAVPHTDEYYLKCMLGGVLSRGLTHTLVTPLDVTKCNMQVNPTKYPGLRSGLQLIRAEEGTKALFKGWVPTLFGYSAQGLFKFGLYEVFKDYYSTLAGQENAKKYRSLIWLAGSASAEFFADVALCPFEMIKVKVQVSAHGTFPVHFTPAFQRMMELRAENKFPTGSLPALWGRQIPYTMAKFSCFEKVSSLFYTHVFTEPKDTYSEATQLGITFVSGYLAGIICAIVSHPADTLVSLRGKAANKGKTYGEIRREVGWVALCTKGLGTRILMIGTLTGLQWWIYKTF